jgi:hypothetical protein
MLQPVIGAANSWLNEQLLFEPEAKKRLEYSGSIFRPLTLIFSRGFPQVIQTNANKSTERLK